MLVGGVAVVAVAAPPPGGARPALDAGALTVGASGPEGATAVQGGPPTAWRGPTGIHVVHPAGAPPYLAAAGGGQVLLRGVDTNALVQYSSRPGCAYDETVPITRADLAEMAALGFDLLRLAVSWSRIEPQPGVFSAAYLDQIRTVVHQAAAAGLAVVVDMHQDRYNRHLWCGQEVDGAPGWATVTLGAPCTPVVVSTVCAQVATQAFWSDTAVHGHGLQHWYLGALRRVAAAVSGATNVAGIELMNEPTPGVVAPPAFELGELYPFYRRMIVGLRSAGYHGTIWFEPSVLRDETDNARYAAVRFSTDPQLVYAVHIYTGVFSYPQGPNNTELQLAQSYRSAAAEAAAFGTPWIDDEFGADASAAWDTWITRQLALQDRFVVGSGFWLWKQRPGFYGWSVVRPHGRLRSSTMRAQLLSLPHVDQVPGRLVATSLTGLPGLPGAPDVRGGQLSATVDSATGGTVVLWSGTEVLAGGRSLITSPWTRVTVDGHRAVARCSPVHFAIPAGADGPSLSLAGCRVTVEVTAGRHVVVLRP